MSDYEKHIGKLKKIDLSEYDGSTEKFFEEQYRKLFTKNLGEEKIKDLYSWSENTVCRRDRGIWEYLFFDTCIDFDMENKFYVVNGAVYENIEDREPDDLCFLKDNGDGTFDYAIEFYNGCTWLGECIEHELKKLK